MALHTSLEIYRNCYELLGEAAEVVRNMRRDIKQAIGGRILDACIDLDLHVRDANMAQDKEPHLLALLRSLEAVELLTRVARDRRWIPVGHYGRLTLRTQVIGKQANTWRNAMRNAGAQVQPELFGTQGSRNRG